MRALLLAIVIAWAAPASAEKLLGKADAPITIIEYASLTCPHCAEFHKTILPQIKTNWIDTGKAKLLYRDFPLDQLALRAAMMARCVPDERYFGLLDILFQQQQTWATARDPLAALGRIGKLAGLTDAQFQACMANKELGDQVVQETMTGQSQFNVTGTPTLIINGKKVDNARGYADYDRILKEQPAS